MAHKDLWNTNRTTT